MKKLLAAVCLLLMVSAAHAQTGSVKTQAALNTEIGTTGCTLPTCLYPDSPAGSITAFGLRQGLLDLTATMFSGGGVPINGPATTVSGDFVLWNSTTGTLVKDGTAGTGVTTALGLPVNATGGVLTFSIIGTSGATLGLLNANKTDSGTNIFSGVNDYGTPSAIVLTNATGLPLTTGVSDILPVANGGIGVGTLASGKPLFGAGTAAITTGTLSGNTTVLATTTGSLTNGHCVSIDSSGNLIDAGGACTTGGGGGTVSTGAAGQLAYYATSGTTVAGLTLGTGLSITGTTLNAAGDVTSVGGATGAILLGTGLPISGNTVNTPWTVSGSDITNNNAGSVTAGGILFASGGATASTGFDNVTTGSVDNLALVVFSTAIDESGVGFNYSGSTNAFGAPTGTMYIGSQNGYGISITANGAEQARIWNSVGASQFKVLNGYADLREWGTTKPVCNAASPTSTNVAAAAVAALAAGWTHLFMPAGCFLYTNDAAWTGTYAAYSIPADTHWKGEDWNTSGFSVCATYTGCTPASQDIGMGANSSYENMFYQSASCYNLDGGSFGHPAYCPIQVAVNNGNGGGNNMTNYPRQWANIYCNPFTVPGATSVPDAACLGMTQQSQGDGIFIQDNGGCYSGCAVVNSAKFLNFFNQHGVATQLMWDGRLILGNSSTSHSSGIINVTDTTGANCTYFPGNTTWTCSSDARLKKNIRADGNEIAWLDTFKIKHYDWTKTGAAAVGPIAQELEKTHPELVHLGDSKQSCSDENHKGCMIVDTPDIWQMLKVMQDMQSEIVALQHKAHR